MNYSVEDQLVTWLSRLEVASSPLPQLHCRFDVTKDALPEMVTWVSWRSNPNPGTTISPSWPFSRLWMRNMKSSPKMLMASFVESISVNCASLLPRSGHPRVIRV